MRRREETGKGGWIDCSLLDSQVGVLGNQALNYLVSGETPQRLGNAHPNVVPYEVFPVRDGHVIIAVGNDGQFRRLCATLDAGEIADDARYGVNALRVANRAPLIAQLTARTRQFSKADLLTRLEAATVPTGPINGIDEVFDDPQVRYRRMQVDLPAPDAAAGAIPAIRTPILIDGDPMMHPAPSPRLGAHGDDVLADPAWGRPDLG